MGATPFNLQITSFAWQTFTRHSSDHRAACSTLTGHEILTFLQELLIKGILDVITRLDSIECRDTFLSLRALLANL